MAAPHDLLPVVYDELRRLAAANSSFTRRGSAGMAALRGRRFPE